MAVWLSKSVTKGSINKHLNSDVGISGAVLQKAALGMLPFYMRIASNKRYAEEWSKAIVSADLDRMKMLLGSVSRLAAKQGLGTNGIGYFIDFDDKNHPWFLSNGTTIPPGKVRFHFSTRVHRAISGSVLPFYRQLASNRAFADALAKVIRRNEKELVERIVRGLVCTSALKSVSMQEHGIVLSFKYPFSKYSYENLLLREPI